MRVRVNRLFAARTLRDAIVVALLIACAASAQPATRSMDERWIPEFANTSGVTFGRQHATVSSDCRAPGSNPPVATSCNPEIPDYGSQLRRGADDDELATTPYVGGT